MAAKTFLPTVGRIVHYHLENGQQRPAIILRVDHANETCDLLILTLSEDTISGPLRVTNNTWEDAAVPAGESPGCWSPPPLVGKDGATKPPEPVAFLEAA